MLGLFFLSRGFFGSWFLGGSFLSRSSFFGSSFSWFHTSGFGFGSSALLQASGFILVDNTVLGGFIKSTLCTTVAFSTRAFCEGLKRAFKATASFTIAN